MFQKYYSGNYILEILFQKFYGNIILEILKSLNNM